jgi:hypothetical protein
MMPVDVKEQTDQHIRDHRKISTDETASEMRISRGKKGEKKGMISNR